MTAIPLLEFMLCILRFQLFPQALQMYANLVLQVGHSYILKQPSCSLFINHHIIQHYTVGANVIITN
jgi:hypothetical protein